jgi:GAF domain-containing protein
MSIAAMSSADDANVSGSYRQLAEIYHDLLSRDSLEQVLDRLVKTVTRLIPVESILLAETCADEGVLRPLVAEGTWPDGFLATTLPFGEGLIGLTAERGRPILCNDAHLDARAGQVAGTPVNEPEAIVCVPLVARGMVIGAMSLYREGEGQVFSDFEFELAQRFGDAAALAIENARTRSELRELSRRDELTGLLNRRGFNDVLASALADGKRQETPVALVLVDLDDFKRINDQYGHYAGDEVLCQVAAQLARAAASAATSSPSCSRVRARGRRRSSRGGSSGRSPRRRSSSPSPTSSRRRASASRPPTRRRRATRSSCSARQTGGCTSRSAAG